MNLDKDISFILLDNSVQQQKTTTSYQTNKQYDSVQRPKATTRHTWVVRQIVTQTLSWLLHKLSSRSPSLWVFPTEANCWFGCTMALNSSCLSPQTLAGFKWIEDRNSRLSKLHHLCKLHRENKQHFITRRTLQRQQTRGNKGHAVHYGYENGGRDVFCQRLV